MQPDTRMLIITNQQHDLQDLRTILSGNGNKPEILVARARQLRPQLCVLGSGMLTLNGRPFSNALKQACPEVDIFIVENGELADTAVATA